ncbi:MAG TPA: LysM peptidoglycan-binding domain-containing protein [Anaerolineae bacterium]|nr:LysM peptidoglycan-binding domain-containing protein [Anaerolineae bacterium]HPL29972.1 LysM peptidoglycan-binding domain-containing protein [Anaerolineae bacterium]
MGLTGKRMIVLIIFVLLVMTGLGTALMAQGAASAAPDTTGTIWASSSLDVPVAAVPPQQVVSPSGAAPNQRQIDLYAWQLEEAWRQGDWNRCIEVLTIVLTIDPANAAMCERLYQARVNLGWLLLSRQQFDDAFKQFTIALQLRPSGQEALEGLRLLQQLIVPPITVLPTPQPPPPTPAPLLCTPAPAPTVCIAGGTRVYIVQRGDNLFRIALRFNTSVALIMKANGLQTTTLKAGQKLIIP